MLRATPSSMRMPRYPCAVGGGVQFNPDAALHGSPRPSRCDGCRSRNRSPAGSRGAREVRRTLRHLLVRRRSRQRILPHRGSHKESVEAAHRASHGMLPLNVVEVDEASIRGRGCAHALSQIALSSHPGCTTSTAGRESGSPTRGPSPRRASTNQSGTLRSPGAIDPHGRTRCALAWAR